MRIPLPGGCPLGSGAAALGWPPAHSRALPQRREAEAERRAPPPGTGPGSGPARGPRAHAHRTHVGAPSRGPRPQQRRAVQAPGCRQPHRASAAAEARPGSRPRVCLARSRRPGESAPPSALFPCPSARPRPRSSLSARPLTREPGFLSLGPPFADARAAPAPSPPHPGSSSSPSRQTRGPPGPRPRRGPRRPRRDTEGREASLFQRRARGPSRRRLGATRTHPPRSLRLPELTPTRWRRAPCRGARWCNWWIL